MPSSKARKHQSPLVASTIESKDKKPKDSKNRKRKASTRQQEQDDQEERRLTSLIFGGGSGGTELPRQQEESESEEETNQQEQGEALFEIDYTGDDGHHEHEEASDGEEQDDAQEQQNRKDDDSSDDENNELLDKTVWQDDDDVDLSVDLMQTNRLRKLRKSRSENVASMNGAELEKRLRKRFETTTQVTAQTDWARLDQQKDQEETSGDDDELLGSSAAPLLASSLRKLPPQILQVVRCPDANQEDPNNAAVQAVQFHPGSDPDRPLMLTAGLDKTLRFFHVNEEQSDKIHGIFFEQLPIYSASFLGHSNNVVVSGRRSFFYIYDMQAGKLDKVPQIMGRQEKSLERFASSPDGKTIAFLGNDGYVILMDVKSRQWIADLKMNGSVRAVTFTPDGEELLASGSDGDVYRFDMKSRRCIERFANEDGTNTSSLSVSNRFLAVGAESGVVNLYNDWSMSSQRRTNRIDQARRPVKSIMNLHTSCDFTRFNHDGQILAMSTRRESQNTLKMLHVPTQTVFSNWPTSKTPLSYVWSMDFSPESKFFATGNDKGKVLLYKLLHYQD